MTTEVEGLAGKLAELSAKATGGPLSLLPCPHMPEAFSWVLDGDGRRAFRLLNHDAEFIVELVNAYRSGSGALVLHAPSQPLPRGRVPVENAAAEMLKRMNLPCAITEHEMTCAIDALNSFAAPQPPLPPGAPDALAELPDGLVTELDRGLSQPVAQPTEGCTGFVTMPAPMAKALRAAAIAQAEAGTSGTSDNRICQICDGGPGNDCACTCGFRRWEAAPSPEPSRQGVEAFDQFRLGSGEILLEEDVSMNGERLLNEAIDTLETAALAQPPGAGRSALAYQENDRG